MKPGLLVNENFPAPSTHALRAAGVDVIAVIDRHRGISDREVMALAREQGRWLLTFDTDYAELVFHQRLPPPPAVVKAASRPCPSSQTDSQPQTTPFTA